MDVITMYTVVLQVTTTGLTPEEPGAWTICQAGGPGWAQLIMLQSGPPGGKGRGGFWNQDVCTPALL